MKFSEKLLKVEVTIFHDAFKKGHNDKARLHLGRAHIISQASVSAHLYVHFLMLLFAVKTFDLKELLGQVLRLVVTIPGHLFGKVPIGNTGWSSVALTERIELPDDLKHLVD